ncbi:MAG TPA: disulfide bond formation protein B [Steroidobacteraceae bacterium]|nr:disulfide bond formation protein B [Steroidobacteraceae bacterium]
MLRNRRLLNAAGAAACLAMLLYAFYAQYVLRLEPCPLCMFQRITILALGIVFAVAAIHHPRGWGSYVYAFLIAAAALATIGIAARHLYIQSLPPGTVPACGAPLDALVRMFPLTEVIRKVLRGGGECAVVNWRLLGLAMPGWVLLCAAVLGAIGVLTNVMLVHPERHRPQRGAQSPA